MLCYYFLGGTSRRWLLSCNISISWKRLHNSWKEWKSLSSNLTTCSKNVFLVHEWRHKFLSNNLIKSSFCGFHFLISCLGSLHASIARICRRKVKKGQNPQMNQWILFASGFYIIIFSCTEMSTCDITIFRLSWRLVHVIVNFIFTV